MRRLSQIATLATLAAGAVLPLAREAAAATTCDPARVMVLFDRSTSMIKGFIGSDSKWELATTALRDVVRTYQGQTEFGLTVFPQTEGDCKDGGRLVVNPPALNAYTGVDTALKNNAPGTNSWTPIGQAVKEMASVTSMLNTDKRRYLILVTDGAQSCPSTQSGEIWSTDQIVPQVTALKDKGITTFVIGFGASSSGGGGDDGVDAYTLNKMAVAGGTAIRGCNPDGRDPNRDDLCYYQADDADSLAAALEEIAIQVSEEQCDGLDNNCNGQIDEGLMQACSTACGPGTQRCTNGTWGTCSATQPQPETCDGADNNCNGQVDEGCACRNGETRPCGRPAGNWICKPGIQRCVNGQWSTVCEGEVGPQPETCDGVDTNCDGIGDGDCVCINATTEICGGPNVGQCREGTRTCVNGNYGECVGAVGPSTEVCDGIDNDCDGMIDEPVRNADDDVPHNLCASGQICQDGHCVAVTPNNPPPGGNQLPGGEASGCACKVGGSASSGPSAGGLLLGLLFVSGLVARRFRR